MNAAGISVIIPLYKSEENLPRLFGELERIAASSPAPFEVVFVDDGSPDRSGEITNARLSTFPFPVQFLRLSRNFGSFAAISAGLQQARGDYFAVLAADLQEPPELVFKFYEEMSQRGADVVFGLRAERDDPMFSMLASRIFWGLYRHLVNPQIPAGGVDIFGCNRAVRDCICALKEVETSLVGLLFWVGFRRAFIPYTRRPRQEGKSAWTLSKKINYLINSVFNFTDLPIRLLLLSGLVGILTALLGASFVLWARISGAIGVPGYTATVLVVMFFGGLTATGLGIVGQYLWLCLQNTRNRPAFIVQSQAEWTPGLASAKSSQPESPAPLPHR